MVTSVLLLAVNGNCGPVPPSLATLPDPSKPETVVFLRTMKILGVGLMGGTSQVLSAVVESVPVDVVDDLAWGCADDESMEEDSSVNEDVAIVVETQTTNINVQVVIHHSGQMFDGQSLHMRNIDNLVAMASRSHALG